MSETQDRQPAALAGTRRASVRPGAPGLCAALALAAAGLGATPGQKAAGPLPSGRVAGVGILAGATLTDAKHLFYNARYEAAADLTLVLRRSASQDLANDELRSSALLFQLKALLETPGDKEGHRKDALENCATCPALMKAFFEDVTHGQTLARAALRANPDDDVALFYLGKLDLNYVWLQLGPLRRRTGWNEYWEARRSLDAVLEKDPRHVRALVARAWIDYIVDTKMPWGTRWILGGGSRKRALVAVGKADAIDSSFYAHTEAEFALWDMRVREGDVAGATEVARRLAGAFPENKEVASYLESQEKNVRR